ncbi:hypothetical protein YC2023_025031 [Brassica napus]
MRSTVIGLPPYHVFSSEKLEDTTNDFGAAIVQRLYQGRHSSENERYQNEAEKSFPQSLAQKMEVLSNLRHLHLVSVLVLSLLRSEQATIDRRCSGSSSATRMDKHWEP